jgi:hypothetical protein
LFQLRAALAGSMPASFHQAAHSLRGLSAWTVHFGGGQANFCLD